MLQFPKGQYKIWVNIEGKRNSTTTLVSNIGTLAFIKFTSSGDIKKVSPDFNIKQRFVADAAIEEDFDLCLIQLPAEAELNGLMMSIDTDKDARMVMFSTPSGIVDPGNNNKKLYLCHFPTRTQKLTDEASAALEEIKNG